MACGANLHVALAPKAPDCSLTTLRPHITYIDEVLSDDECKHVIKLCYEQGFEDVGYQKEFGGHVRAMFHDEQMASLLWERVKHLCPTEYKDEQGTWESFGLNPRFRILKYVKGQYNSKHVDGQVHLDEKTVSFWTFTVYLNGPFERGRTRFYKRDPDTQKSELDCAVEPSRGRAICFVSETEHDGEETEGDKYIMRTEVFFKLVHEAPKQEEEMSGKPKYDWDDDFWKAT